MQILALNSIDWMNAVIIPLIMTIVLGTLLAIYTGVVLARFVAFDAARMATCRTLAKIRDLPEAKNEDEFNAALVEIASELVDRTAEFHVLRQRTGASHAQFFLQRLVRKPWSEGKLVFPFRAGTPEAEINRELHGVWSKMAFDIQPDFFSLITLRGRVTSREKATTLPFEEMLNREKLIREQWIAHRLEREAQSKRILNR